VDKVYEKFDFRSNFPLIKCSEVLLNNNLIFIELLS